MTKIFKKKVPCSMGPVIKPVPTSSVMDKHQIKPTPTPAPMDKHQIKQIPTPMADQVDFNSNSNSDGKQQSKPTPIPMDKQRIKLAAASVPMNR